MVQPWLQTLYSPQSGRLKFSIRVMVWPDPFAGSTQSLKLKQNAKGSASEKAQERYMLPALALPSPFFLPLLVRVLSIQQQ
jgi:hypothetical protein